MRILLSLVMVLSGLLMAREFMAHSNDQFRLTLRGAKIVSEQSIATVHGPPALVAQMAAARVAEVSAQSIATANEPPAPVAAMAAARVAEVSAQSIATANEPPAPVSAMAVTRIAEVSAQNIATAHEPPAGVAPVAVIRLAEEVSQQRIATAHEPPALVGPMPECEQIWDQRTHMTREEWAEACRRVDDERSQTRRNWLALSRLSQHAATLTSQ